MRFVAVIFVFMSALASLEAQLSCDNYNPVVCLPDLKNYCLVNGTMMQGTCEAQTAICGQGAKEATEIGCCQGTAECKGYNSATSSRPAAILLLAAILLHSLRLLFHL